VDRAGNANLIDAAARNGAAIVLVSVVGTFPRPPIELFGAKHAAEEALRGSGIPWTIVPATGFMETWDKIMGRPLQTSGKIVVFGRGDNPINFVSATDVAALVRQAAIDPSLCSQVLELGGPDNLAFNELAAILQETTGCRGTVRHIPPPNPARVPERAEHRHAISPQRPVGLKPHLTGKDMHGASTVGGNVLVRRPAAGPSRPAWAGCPAPARQPRPAAGRAAA
jgi:uncharacterized protein YbjT (DUF2867 family)